MIKAAALLLLLPMVGCATYVTDAGRKITVIRDNGTELVSDCRQLGILHGEPRSILTGGDYGLIYATNDARNKAAQISGADTLVILDSRSSRFGGSVSGMAYDCSEKRNQPLKKAPSFATAADRAVEKAGKCKAKGGVWRNNQCVIPVE